MKKEYARCENCIFAHSWSAVIVCHRYPQEIKRERSHWCGEFRLDPSSYDHLADRDFPNDADALIREENRRMYLLRLPIWWFVNKGASDILKQEGVFLFEQLLMSGWGEKRLRSIHGIGGVTIAQLKRALRDHGYHLLKEKIVYVP